MFDLPSHYVWDFWTAHDGERHHLFFLKAPRSLGDPDLRHRHATVGHASSSDLVDWIEHADALGPGPAGAPDDLAVWTGSVVRRPDGTWRMFHTGIDREHRGRVQRITWVDSADLETWTRTDPPPVLEPGPGYETPAHGTLPEQTWRDPFVFAAADGWRMLITARVTDGPADCRGVVGVARSPDLEHWTVGAPLSDGSGGFGHLEVLQRVEVDGAAFLLFSCLTPQLARVRRAAGQRGGVWAVPIDGDGPYDLTRAHLLTDQSHYVGRIVRHRGRSVFLAFRNDDGQGRFVGGITDPVGVRLHDGRLVLDPG